MNKLKIISTLLLCLLLFGWWLYEPYPSGDSYYDLSRIFYYIVIIPLGVIGLLYAVIILTYLELGIASVRKNILFIILFCVSLCTVIPPVFQRTRYIFWPIAKIEYKIEQRNQRLARDKVYIKHYAYFKSGVINTHKVKNVDCGFILLDNDIVVKPINRDFMKNQSDVEPEYLVGKPVNIELSMYEDFKNGYSTIISIQCLKGYKQIIIDDAPLGAALGRVTLLEQ